MSVGVKFFVFSQSTTATFHKNDGPDLGFLKKLDVIKEVIKGVIRKIREKIIIIRKLEIKITFFSINLCF